MVGGTGPVSARLLVYAFAEVAQFSIVAGDTSALAGDELQHLNRNAGEVATVTQAVRNAVALRYSAKHGQVLMLGVPVEEPEKASGRRGLCVVFVAYVSRRRVVAPAILAQMITSLEQAISDVCSIPCGGFVMAATALTQLLQRHNDDTALAAISTVTDDLSDLFTSILYSRYGRLRNILTLTGEPLPDYRIFNTAVAGQYYAVLTIASTVASESRGARIYYYIPLSSGLGERRLPANIMTSVFIGSGIVIGHAVRDR